MMAFKISIHVKKVEKNYQDVTFVSILQCIKKASGKKNARDEPSCTYRQNTIKNIHSNP